MIETVSSSLELFRTGIDTVLTVNMFPWAMAKTWELLDDWVTFKRNWSYLVFQRTSTQSAHHCWRIPPSANLRYSCTLLLLSVRNTAVSWVARSDVFVPRIIKLLQLVFHLTKKNFCLTTSTYNSLWFSLTSLKTFKRFIFCSTVFMLRRQQ